MGGVVPLLPFYAFMGFKKQECLPFYLEVKWNSNGMDLELKWNSKGMDLELKWNSNGMDLELKWNSNGMDSRGC